MGRDIRSERRAIEAALGATVGQGISFLKRLPPPTILISGRTVHYRGNSHGDLATSESRWQDTVVAVYLDENGPVDYGDLRAAKAGEPQRAVEVDAFVYLCRADDQPSTGNIWSANLLDTVSLRPVGRAQSFRLAA